MNIEQRKKAAHELLTKAVEELSAIDEAEGSEYSMPTSWVLCVGYENIDEVDELSGAIGVYPKDGSMAEWKAIGILRSALLKVEHG